MTYFLPKLGVALNYHNMVHPVLKPILRPQDPAPFYPRPKKTAMGMHSSPHLIPGSTQIRRYVFKYSEEVSVDLRVGSKRYG